MPRLKRFPSTIINVQKKGSRKLQNPSIKYLFATFNKVKKQLTRFGTMPGSQPYMSKHVSGFSTFTEIGAIKYLDSGVAGLQSPFGNL